MSLKNRGINFMVILFSLIIGAVIVWSFFDPAMSIGRAPTGNKVVGAGLGVLAIVFAFKSVDWLDFIEDDNRKLMFQIIGTLAIGILAFLVLAVFHSGPLGTTTNPI